MRADFPLYISISTSKEMSSKPEAQKPSTKRKERPSSEPTAENESSDVAIFGLQDTDHTLSDLPPDSILLHSTNCFGSWGAGVALAIRDLFPAAAAVYASYCDSFRPKADAWPEREQIAGTCLLIPPQPGDFASAEGGVWIACLFTSYGFGRPTKRKAGLDKKDKVVEQTRIALEELRKQLAKLKCGEYKVQNIKGENNSEMKVLKLMENGDLSTSSSKWREKIDNGQDKKKQKKDQQDERSISVEMDIYSPKFNSGYFRVKWEETTALIEDAFKGWDGKWFILSPPKE